MTDLSTPIARYFASEKADDDLVLAACFAPDALVYDEAREHRGVAAIVAWRREVQAKTPFISRVLDWSTSGDDVVVATEVSGSFPNSPVHLDQRFTLVDGHIRVLDIR